MPAAYATTINSNTDSINITWETCFSDPLLTALIDTALNNNFDVLSMLQRVEAARAEILFAKGRMLPTVDAGISAGVIRLGEYSADWAGNEGSQYVNGEMMTQRIPDYYLGFSASWEADIWGKLKNQKKAAYSRYLSSVEGSNWVVTSLIAEISSIYYELLSLDNQLEIIRETIQIQENALEIVKIQKRTGTANELAVKQFEGQLLNTKNMERALYKEIISTENIINFLLGRFPQPIERSPALFSNEFPEGLAPGIPSTLLQLRPDIREAEFELMAAKADVASAKAAFLPSLNVTGDIGFNAFNPSYLIRTPESIAYGLLGGLTAPLINRSAIKAEFKQANAYQLEALYNYHKTILNGYVEVANEMVNLDNLDEMYAFKREEVEALNQSIDISTRLFRTGRANYLEVLLAQQNALEAKLDLIDTRKQQYLALTKIYKALGGGWYR
ncbi:MAG: RND transporter [Thalassobius sp.]|nr:RND transporter [Thalassovita sp.]